MPHPQSRLSLRAAQLGAILALAAFPGAKPARAAETRLAVRAHDFQIVPRESGPTNYYSVVDDAAPPFIRADYHRGYQSAVLGFQIPDALRAKVYGLEWSWRARTMPADHSACDAKVGIVDSPALVYVIWKRGLRWYTLRYVWATVAPKGAVCDRKRNPFLAQDTVVLESGSSQGAWMTERIDVWSEFRRRFADGDPTASVPELVGVGLLTDGDQSQSESAADYGSFVLVY